MPEKLKSFYNFHGIQLLGSKFPMQLLEQLHNKISNKTYDAGDYFKIFDNPDQDTYEVHATKPIKALEQVFLVDHAISFRYPQLRGLLTSNPAVLERMDSLTKYLGENKQLLAAAPSPQDPRNVEYDCMELTNLDNLSIGPETVCLSLIDNKLENPKELIQVVQNLKELRAIWFNDNPLEASPELLAFISDHTKIELLNRRFTNHATAWALKFVTFKNIEKAFSTPNADVFYLNLDDRGLLDIDPSLLKEFSNLRHISLR